MPKGVRLSLGDGAMRKADKFPILKKFTMCVKWVSVLCVNVFGCVWRGRKWITTRGTKIIYYQNL